METMVMEPRAVVEVSLGRTSGYVQSDDTGRVNRIIDRVCPPVEKVANAELRMGYEIRNTLTGKRISEVSQGYALVDNKRLIVPFIEHFGLKALRELRTHGNGKYLHAAFETGRQFDMGRGDILKERMVVQNSYDKTRAFVFMFGAFRIACLNQLYTAQAVVAFRKIHVGDIPVENMVQTVLGAYQQNCFELWRNFAQKPLTLDEQMALSAGFKAYVEEEQAGKLVGVLTNVEVNKDVNRVTANYLQKPESLDNQRTAWGFFNQANRAIRQVVDGNSQINKRILGNKNLEKYIQDCLVS